MKVPKDYYDSARFHNPGVVAAVVEWCNTHMRGFQSQSHPEFLMAKRIKSLCLKNYKVMRDRSGRFCKEWEESPKAMMEWVLKEFPDGKCKITRVDPSANFEPSNIELRPLR